MRVGSGCRSRAKARSGSRANGPGPGPKVRGPRARWFCALEVVEERPIGVATHVDAVGERGVDRAQAAGEVADAPLVVGVAIGDARLGDDEGQLVASPEGAQRSTERVGAEVAPVESSAQ